MLKFYEGFSQSSIIGSSFNIKNQKYLSKAENANKL